MEAGKETVTQADGGAGSAWERTNTVFTNEKAGMKGIDKDKVKRIIYEMSKVNHLSLAHCNALREDQ